MKTWKIINTLDVCVCEGGGLFLVCFISLSPHVLNALFSPVDYLYRVRGTKKKSIALITRVKGAGRVRIMSGGRYTSDSLIKKPSNSSDRRDVNRINQSMDRCNTNNAVYTGPLNPIEEVIRFFRAVSATNHYVS